MKQLCCLGRCSGRGQARDCKPFHAGISSTLHSGVNSVKHLGLTESRYCQTNPKYCFIPDNDFAVARINFYCNKTVDMMGLKQGTQSKAPKGQSSRGEPRFTIRGCLPWHWHCQATSGVQTEPTEEHIPLVGQRWTAGFCEPQTSKDWWP